MSRLIKVLEKYLAYGESVMGKYGRRPTMRDIMKVGTKITVAFDFLFSFFHSL